MRVKKFKQRRNASNFKGKFPSLKLGRAVMYETLLERDYIYLLEFGPDITYYEEKPSLIEYTSSGSGRPFSADFLVSNKGKDQLIKIKPRDHADTEEDGVLYRSFAALSRQQGYDFLLMTESAIRAQPRLNNVKLLWRYSRVSIAPRHQVLCSILTRGNEGASLSDVVEHFQARNISREVVYALLYWGVLTCDLTKPLGPATLLSLPAAAAAERRAS